MTLLRFLKKLPFVPALIALVKRSHIGRAAIKQARYRLGIDQRPPVALAGNSAAAAVDQQQPSVHRSEEFRVRRAEWRDQGATPALVHEALTLAGNTIAWGVLHPSTWLVYCAVLIEADDRHSAERVLRTYVSRFGLDAVADVLPVAQFARELGFRSAQVDRSAGIADILEANQARNPFAELVSNKTIAVVGNGPGNLNTGRGAEIDAHDIVIRFNNYPDGFAGDYGARTDVWVRGAHKDVNDRHDLEQYALVLWEMDFSRNFIEHPEHRHILYRDTLLCPDKIAFIDTATKLSLREASGLMLPTSGAQVIWALLQARGGLDGVDVYGFSSVDGSDDYGHFFDALGDMGRRHDVHGERAFLRGLLSASPAPGASRSPRGKFVVFNCAYREYHPARGRTGGPGGVLATQQRALGNEFRGNQLRYLFDHSDKAQLRDQLAPLVQGVRGKIADIILGGEYVRTHPEITAAREAGHRLLLVCHELGSAFGAYQLGVPYVIVYHQQGSTLQEMRSIGQLPSAFETRVAKRLEELICGNARKMYFPSIGARETFKATADPALVAKVEFADSALYNTVSAADHGARANQRGRLPARLSRKLGLPRTDNAEVFLSVGDWNRDKGLDRVPSLLERYVEHSGRKVVWIGVGSALDPARFAEIEAKKESWPFEAHLIGTRIKHERLLALLDHADFYVMMQRKSIFDLATLEAMRGGKPLVLSPVGGNLEVDLNNNVVFVTEDTMDDACRDIVARDRLEWGERNRAVYDKHFSVAHFADRYRAMLDEQFAALRDDDPERGRLNDLP